MISLIAVIKYLIEATYGASGLLWLTVWRAVVHYSRKGTMLGSLLAAGASSSCLLHGANKEPERQIRARHLESYSPALRTLIWWLGSMSNMGGSSASQNSAIIWGVSVQARKYHVKKVKFCCQVWAPCACLVNPAKSISLSIFAPAGLAGYSSFRLSLFKLFLNFIHSLRILCMCMLITPTSHWTLLCFSDHSCSHIPLICIIVGGLDR